MIKLLLHPFQVYSSRNMNRAHTPSKKSITPGKKSSMARSSSSKSPLKRNSPRNLLLLEKLRNNREKLTHTLDTYTMLIRSKHPIRCLEHNSVVSVYCQTENRLLCTNCIFTSPTHKFHKVTPVDKSELLMAEKLQKMTSEVETEARVIQNIAETIMINLAKDEETTLKALETLSVRYAQAHKLLDQSFYAVKKSLMTTLEDLKIKHQTVSVELKLLGDLYVSPFLLSDFTEEADPLQELIYRHSMLQTLIKQKKFEGNVSPQQEKTCDDISRRELTRIEKVKERLKEVVSICSHQG